MFLIIAIPGVGGGVPVPIDGFKVTQNEFIKYNVDYTK